MLVISKELHGPAVLMQDTHRVPCSYGKVYIGTTKLSVNTRIGEPKQHWCHKQHLTNNCHNLKIKKNLVYGFSMKNFQSVYKEELYTFQQDVYNNFNVIKDYFCVHYKQHYYQQHYNSCITDIILNLY